MLINFLGGALEVGGSSILVNLDGKNILLDAGIRQGGTKDNIPNFITIQEHGGLDAIIISHAHLDHIGCLPLISREYPDVRIYMNNMTKDLTKVILYDSIKIMNNSEGEIPIYAEKDVEETLNRIFTINYEARFSIFDNIYLTFYNAGHIAGASAVYLQGKEGTLLYTGDFSLFPQKTIEGARIPKLRPDVMITETTYGDRLHSNRQTEEEILIDTVNECIEKGGKMLIPAFALGRAQEVLLILKNAMTAGKLKKVKVFADGMVRDINRTYKNNPIYLKNSLGKKILRGKEPFYDDNIMEVSRTENSRDDIINLKEPAVIVTSSGMLTGGPSVVYAEKIAPLENGYIVITGYQDEEAPGRKILSLLEAEDDEEKVLSVNGHTVPVKCTLKKVGLSAHADKSEIRSLVEKLSPKNLFMVHGDEKVVQSFAQEIAKDYRGRVFAPKCGENFEINIRVPRKQLDKNLAYSLNLYEELNEEVLWKFINENYPGKLFTIEDLIYIWSGRFVFDETEICLFREKILSGIYFEMDVKRLFLFKTRTIEEIKELAKPKEVTAKDMEILVTEMFKDYDYKKISYMQEDKKIVLNFDFPNILKEDIYKLMDKFNEENEWKISINQSVNINAISSALKKYVNPSIIKKISFHIEKSEAEVNLFDEISDMEYVKNKMVEETGFKVIFNFENKKITTEDAEEETAAEKISYAEPIVKDQNEVMYYIDEAFRVLEHKPYKKSVKNTPGGKLIECAFITPVIGHKYDEVLKSVEEFTGWNIIVSKKVNQNEVKNIAEFLCSKNNIVLKKVPSYNPSSSEVVLKIQSGEENFSKIKEDFEKMTGLDLRYIL